MPRNPGKTPCSIDGCRAWAIRSSDPPLCSPHSTCTERTALASGEPTAAPALDPLGLESLDAGLVRARLALHRVLDLLASDLAPADVIRLAELALRGAGTVSRLIRTHRALADAAEEPAAASRSDAIAAIVELARGPDEES